MPYSLRRSGTGYFVVTQGTRRKHSKRPLSRRMAVRQMRALYASERSERSEQGAGFRKGGLRGAAVGLRGGANSIGMCVLWHGIVYSNRAFVEEMENRFRHNPELYPGYEPFLEHENRQDIDDAERNVNKLMFWIQSTGEDNNNSGAVWALFNCRNDYRYEYLRGPLKRVPYSPEVNHQSDPYFIGIQFRDDQRYAIYATDSSIETSDVFVSEPERPERPEPERRSARRPERRTARGSTRR